VRHSPYDQWLLVEAFVRCPNSLRITIGALTMGFGLLLARAILGFGLCMVMIGGLMLAHGIFGQPEDGPGP